MTIDSRFLEKMGVRNDRAERFGGQFSNVLPGYGIDTPLREAHFAAQVLHESGMCRYTKENLNYSADALKRVFGKYFPNISLAREYERRPERIGSRVYANRMGNGDEAGGEGYHYRGRGLIQLTGKDNYRAFADWIGVDVVDNPALVAEEFPVASAVFFWDTNNLNRIADQDDLRQLTKRINGGYNGLDHRRQLLEKAKQLQGITDAPVEQSPGGGDLYRVTASSLNLRGTPEIRGDNVVGSLARDERVEKMAAIDPQGWVRVRAVGNGKEGFVAARYLRMV